MFVDVDSELILEFWGLARGRRHAKDSIASINRRILNFCDVVSSSTASTVSILDSAWINQPPTLSSHT